MSDFLICFLASGLILGGWFGALLQVRYKLWWKKLLAILVSILIFGIVIGGMIYLEHEKLIKTNGMMDFVNVAPNGI